MSDAIPPTSADLGGTANINPPVFPGPPADYIHSPIYEALVESNDDLPGIVAYGLYQKRKRAWLEDYEKKNKRKPCQIELENFSFSFRDDALSALRTEAEGYLFRFASEIMEKQIQDMSEEAFNSRAIQELAALRGTIAKISGYKHHIVGHIAGFVVLVFLAFIFTVAIRYEPHVATLFSNDHGAATAKAPPAKMVSPPPDGK